MYANEPVFDMQMSHVRSIFGFACREVVRTGRPLGIRRYHKTDVVMVPLAEWERLKRMEAELMATNEKAPPLSPANCPGRKAGACWKAGADEGERGRGDGRMRGVNGSPLVFSVVDGTGKN